MIVVELKVKDFTRTLVLVHYIIQMNVDKGQKKNYQV